MSTASLQAPSLGHMPASSTWDFDPSVARVFDDMLQRSIPAYRIMRHAVLEIARRYRKDDTDIVDLGASRGEAVAPLLQQCAQRNRFILVERSEAMLDELHRRFGGFEEMGVVQVHNTDLRYTVPPSNASVVLCVLTLQFLPVEFRPSVLRRVYEDLLPGGSLILVEKLIEPSRELDTMMRDIYYQLKRDNGYTPTEIEAKREALENVMVPLSAQFNEQLLHAAGFSQVACFWRWFNFAGWVAVR